jgi:hypothetical protein
MTSNFIISRFLFPLIIYLNFLFIADGTLNKNSDPEQLELRAGNR